MREVWRMVQGYEGIYEVSNLGRVKSLHLPYPVIRNPSPVNGYPSLFLSKGKKKSFFYVHHLVAFAFLGPRPPGHEVAHGDGNKSNCALSNIRYATPVENDSDKVLHGTRPLGSKNGQSKLTEYDVIVMRTRVAAGETQKVVGRDYELASGMMSKIINRHLWRHI